MTIALKKYFSQWNGRTAISFRKERFEINARTVLENFFKFFKLWGGRRESQQQLKHTLFRGYTKIYTLKIHGESIHGLGILNYRSYIIRLPYYDSIVKHQFYITIFHKYCNFSI